MATCGASDEAAREPVLQSPVPLQSLQDVATAKERGGKAMNILPCCVACIQLSSTDSHKLRGKNTDLRKTSESGQSRMSKTE